jgi:hypothetical protein
VLSKLLQPASDFQLFSFHSLCSFVPHLTNIVVVEWWYVRSAMLKQLLTRLADYQATSVSKDFHLLTPTGPCGEKSPAANPSWNDTWMPYCKDK